MTTVGVAVSQKHILMKLYHHPLCPTSTQADVLVPDDMDMSSLQAE